MSCPIAWCSLSWEATATFVTGLAAVAAAWNIGRKQMQIQAATVRSELFDRRFENYESVRDFILESLQNPTNFNQAAIARFQSTKREARFLFSDKVHDDLEAIWVVCGELHAKALELEQAQLNDGHAGVTMPREKLALQKALSEKLRILPDIYGEMKLDRSRLLH